MAVEPERGCGYRKAGGLYLVGGGVGEPCERLPIDLSTCPCCKRSPIRQQQGIEPAGVQYIFGQALPCDRGDQAAADQGHHGRCVLCNEKLMAEADPSDEFFVLWIGKQYYSTPADWTKEANKLGVSRRMSSIPKKMVLGKSWVLVAHPEVTKSECPDCEGKGFVAAEAKDTPKECEACEGKRFKMNPAIFHCFRPRAIELVVTPSMRKQAWVKKLVKKNGVELVEVPEDDPDHAPKAKRKSARGKAMDKHARKHATKGEPQEAEA